MEWQEHKDPNTGLRYYFNAVTGVTQWSKPIGDGPLTPTVLQNAIVHRRPSSRGGPSTVHPTLSAVQSAEVISTGPETVGVNQLNKDYATLSRVSQPDSCKMLPRGS